MYSKLFKIAGAGALAAAILGGAMLGQPAAKADTAEACVVRAQETGFCVIAGRPAEPEPAEIIRTAELHTEIPQILGTLPAITGPAENAVTQTQAAPLQSTAAPLTASPEGTLREGARYLGQYKITGYDICAHCCGKTDGITASGTQATVGRTCAAASFLPFGTRIYIDGIGERVVEDRGGGVNGEHIDVLCENHTQCYAITGYYDVYILED